MPAQLIGHADELREVYLMAFDANGTDPVTIEQETENRINTRFARELLGVLTKRKILVVHNVDGEDLWQVLKPGPQNEVSRDEADLFITDWLGMSGEKEVETPAPVGGGKNTRAPKPPAEAHDCYCGCGEQITSKAFYRPGHDARHAGVIGRKIAANHDVKGFDRRDLLNDLPSPALVEKAERIAETAIAKIEKKASKTAGPEAGMVRVGKTMYEAVRYNDGKVVSNDYGKPLSKSAVASFVAGP